MAITYWWDKSVFNIPVAGDVFIETGTKEGNMLWEAKDYFKVCHSIEIDPESFVRYKQRFIDCPNVVLHLGDSPKVMPTIMEADKTTTFYLDAHCEGPPWKPEYTTECPILAEIAAILSVKWRRRPMVIVDDINMFKDSYWTDPNSNHHMFKKEYWPNIQRISMMLSDYMYYEDNKNNVGIFV